jgi:hypothetical protein
MDPSQTIKKGIMFKSTFYIVLLTLIITSGCNTNNSSSTETQSDTLAYKTERYYIESDLEKDTADSINEKTYFEALYPHFENYTINGYINKLITFNDIPDKQYHSIQEAGEGFIQGYEDYQKLDYSSPWPWYSKIEANVVENNKSYLGIEVNYEDFMGGAHGNHGTIFSNFDLHSKKTITIQDIVLDNKMDSLVLIAEQIFKENEGVDSLQNSFPNYFFEDGKFALNNNFLLQENSILFLYNVYEIKSYSEGITRLEIPYSKINNFLTPQAKDILGIK